MEMKRLTNREYGEISCTGREIPCSSFCNNCSQGTGNCEIVKRMVEKLADYEDLEERGLLLRLPCPIGTTVYDTAWWDDVQEKVVAKGKVYYRTVHKHKVTKLPFTYSDIDNFGKTVFLTKSEAEAKLKELRGEE